MENVFTDTALTLGDLHDADPIELYLAFSDAFGKYQPAVNLTAEQFFTKFYDHYQTDPDVSMVLRYRDRIAGFALISTLRKGEIKLAWMSAFGIREAYRGRGWASVLMDHLLAGLRKKRINECSLEVHSSNDPAIDLFMSRGFELRRRLGNYTRLPSPASSAWNGRVVMYNKLEVPYGDLDPDGPDVFQESIQFLEREKKAHISLVALEDSEPAGYLIMDAETGRIRALNVKPKYRRKGIGTCLVEKAASLAGELRILNVDVGSESVRFLEKTGFIKVFEQFEMAGSI